MRSQISNSGQPSGTSDQKKSVFDRLGRQLDTRHSMKRRPSPGPYGDYMPPPPPPMHESNFGRYGRDPQTQAEMEWRYQNERRHLAPFSRDRHQSQLPPTPPPQFHYEMEMPGRQPAPYYPHPYHSMQPGPPPMPPMGPNNMSMNMYQQSSSPKYDRHGNMIVSFKERGPLMRMSPMDHPHSMSPPRSYMPPGPVMHPGLHDMPPMPAGMYPPHRWPEDNMDPDFPPHGCRMMPEERSFSPLSVRRYQQQPTMMSPPPPTYQGQVQGNGSEMTRYTRWRERRDIITSLDRETAQSSSRTDSLKSTLQQADNRIPVKRESTSNLSEAGKVTPTTATTPKTAAELVKKEQKDASLVKTERDATNSDNTKSKAINKPESHDISDGEIVGDEDSSDDSECLNRPITDREVMMNDSYLSRSKNIPVSAYDRSRESHRYYEAAKKRRMHDREEYSMDYETISDEDLDDFMRDKKNSNVIEDAKIAESLSNEGKSISEIELLNALGLDWANLVEMAKQSKASGKETNVPSSALHRFSIAEYLPTLGITTDLAGPEIYDLVMKVCRS